MTSLTAVPVSDMMDMVVDSDQAQATNYSYMFNFEQVYIDVLCEYFQELIEVWNFNDIYISEKRKTFEFILSLFSIYVCLRKIFIWTSFHNLCRRKIN